MRKFWRPIGLAFLLALAVGAVASNVVAQTATRLWGITTAQLAAGATTGSALLCTASGAGCVLTVELSGGAASGAVTVDRAGIATTSTDGFVASNSTASTAGIPVQQSPRLRFRSNVWNTTATAANNTDDWWIESVPVSGTTPSGLLKFGKSLNGGATTFPMTLGSAGTLTVGDVASLGNVQAATSYAYQWANGTNFMSAANGIVNIRNNGGSIGSQLKVDALPTVASGFGTSPTVTAGSTPLAGSINVGTGVPGTGGVLNWAGTAFPSAPFVVCMNQTSLMTVRCTATTTQLTIAASALTASDVVTWMAISSK